MAISPYYLTPDLDQKKETARQKVAQQLLLQGSSGEPVRAYTQGLARMAQGLLGGYDLGVEEAQDKKREASVASAINDLPGMSASPVAGAVAGDEQPAPEPRPASRVATALAPSQPAETPSGSMYEGLPGWKPGERPTFEQPSTTGQTPPVQTAQAPQLPQPVPAPRQQPTVQPPVIPPDVQLRIHGLMSNPATRPIGMQLYEQYTKPKEQFDALITPQERAAAGILPGDSSAYQIDRATRKVSPVNTQPNVSLNASNTAETTYAKGKAEDALGLERSADKTLQQRQQIEVFKSLVNDFKTGKLAPTQSTMGAWGDALGIDPKTMERLGIPPNAAVNGQLIESLSNEMTLGMIGGKGGEGGSMPANNFSDADRKFLQNTVPGLARMQGGNLILADIKARGLDRHLEKVAMWDDYRSAGKSYEVFERDWRRKIMAEPSLFADIPDRIRQLSAAPPPPPPPKGGSIKIDKDGKIIQQ